MHKYLILLMILIVEIIPSGLLFGQCSLSGTQNVSHADIISCLSGCVTCTIVIEDNAVITIPSGDKWDLASNPNKDVTLTIKGSGKLYFAGSGNSGAELIMTAGSILIIENTSNSNALDAQNQGNVRIDIGSTEYKGNDFGDIIAAGGADINGPLPIELLYFQGLAIRNQVNLSWSTAAEINNDYFTLEKSNDGINFIKIKIVTGNGTTNIKSNYLHTDKLPYLGISYYRLSQTDFDGTTEVFNIISVLYTSSSVNFSISPIPISNLSVKLITNGNKKNELIELNILDLQGRLVESKMFKADNYGNIETNFTLKKQLKKGIYIFELVAENYKEYLKVVSN